MTDAEILDAISDVAREHLGWQGELRAEMGLVDVLDLDSLRMLTLAVELENRFRICLDDQPGRELERVADLVTAIRSRLAS